MIFEPSIETSKSRSWSTPIIAAFFLLICGARVSARPPLVSGGGGVVGLPRELIAGSKSEDRFEVYADTLERLPIVCRLHLSIRSSDTNTAVNLQVDGKRWYDQFEVSITKDGHHDPEYHLTLIPGSERLDQHWSTGTRKPAFGDGVPQQLAANPGDTIYSLWELHGPRGSQIASGEYHISIRKREDCEKFFGIDCGIGGDMQILVKERVAGDNNRHTEDLIERHYLWGVCLYMFDRDASWKELRLAWDMVRHYVREGAGDEQGLYNITPRYQAFLIARRLDRNEKAVAYLSALLSYNAEPAECRMRYYHFRRERGDLQRNIRDDLTLQLNRLYEQVYEKTMSGIPVDSVPLRKYFPDAPKSESN